MKQRTLYSILIPVALVLAIGAYWILTNQADSSAQEKEFDASRIDFLPQNDSLSGFDRYEGYGFSIDYPSDMSIEVLGVGAGSANESMGQVEGMLIGKSVELIAIWWVTQQSLPSHVENTPEAVLDYHFILFEESFLTSDQGEIQTGSKDGHDMVYQTFITYSDTTRSRKRGYPLRSIYGAWYCEEAGKYLLLYVAHMPEVSQPNVLSEELESMWQGYLDSFVCH